MPKMTPDQTIALASSVGSCLSGFATVLTVLLMRRQIRLAAQPNIVLPRTPVDWRRSDSYASPFGSPVRALTNAVSGENPRRAAGLQVYNLGNGPAQNIKFRWSFPVEDFVREVKTLGAQIAPDAEMELANGILSVKDDGVDMLIIYANSLESELDYLLPASVIKEPARVTIPAAFEQLAFTFYQLATRCTDRRSDFLVPSLHLSVEYQDVQGSTHSSAFEVSFDVDMFSRDRVTGDWSSAKRADGRLRSTYSLSRFRSKYSRRGPKIVVPPPHDPA